MKHISSSELEYITIPPRPLLGSREVGGLTRRSVLPFAFDGWRRKYRVGRNIRSVCKDEVRTSVRVLVVCRSRREREEAKFCSGKVRAASIVIVFLLVCRSIREYVFLIVYHCRCVREKAFEDSAPGRCGVSSD